MVRFSGICTLLFYLSFSWKVAFSQIPIQNGSFEGIPAGFIVPEGWLQCATNAGSAIMPFGSWIGIALPAFLDSTYFAE